MPKYPCHKKLIGMLSLQEQQLNRMYGVYAARWSDVLKGFGYGKSSSTNLWKGNRRIEAELDKIMLDFNAEVNNYIKGNIDLGWNASDDCNDDLVDRYTKGIDLNNKQVYYARNHEALAAFKTRNINGINLSDRVWAMTYQTKDQIESILGSGIMEGRSAAKMARDLKGYLVEPDRRYRRIRNDQGKLIYSSPGKDYHPGQGVYRSSYKNALRLSRDQTNTAYRSSDNERRKNLDFVTGIEVHLSDQHPKYDICDPLAGRYPKDFNFIGWHSQCICFSTSVLLSEKEFIEYVNGGKIRDQRYIRTIPKSAQNYLNDHSKQIKGWKNTPYFIQDNFKNTKEGFALKKGIITGKANVPIKAPTAPFMPPNIGAFEKALNVTVDRAIFRYLTKKTPLNPKIKNISDGAYFHPVDNYVRIPFDERRKRSKWKAESVVYHEYGHALDWQHNLKDMPEVKYLMDKYRKKYSKNNNELYKSLDAKADEVGFAYFNKDNYDALEMVGAFTDTLMSLNPSFGHGHKKEYWNKKGNKEAEFIAHAFENRYSKNKEFELLDKDLYTDMSRLIDLLLSKIQ